MFLNFDTVSCRCTVINNLYLINFDIRHHFIHFIVTCSQKSLDQKCTNQLMCLKCSFSYLHLVMYWFYSEHIIIAIIHRYIYLFIDFLSYFLVIFLLRRTNLCSLGLIKNVSSSTSHKKTPSSRLSFREFKKILLFIFSFINQFW